MAKRRKSSSRSRAARKRSLKSYLKRHPRMSPSLRSDIRQDIKNGGCAHGRLKVPRRQKSGGLRVCKRRRKKRSKSKRRKRRGMSALRRRNLHYGARCSPGRKKLKKAVRSKSGRWRHCGKRRNSPRKSRSRRRRSRSRRRKSHIHANCPPGHRKLKHPVKLKSGGYRHCTKRKRKSPKKRRKSRRKSRSR